jgi:hypothetical protein
MGILQSDTQPSLPAASAVTSNPGSSVTPPASRPIFFALSGERTAAMTWEKRYKLHLQKQVLKPGFHCIGSGLKPGGFQAMGHPTSAPPRLRSSATTSAPVWPVAPSA